MSLTDNGGLSAADVAAVMGNGNGFGGFGGDGAWWLLVLFLFAFNGNGWGNGYGNGGTQFVDSTVQRGFDQNAVMNGITGLNNAVTTGFGNVQTALCSGFANVNQGIANGFAQAEIANNARQIADMNQAFANQTSMLQGFNGLQSQLAQCCCDNRLATCQTQNLVQNEGASTRLAIQNQTQAILDKLCQQEIEAKNDVISQLRSELMYARGQASQDVQTAAIQAGQRALANEVEQYVAPMPRPSYLVQNPNCCTPNVNCGCGV